MLYLGIDQHASQLTVDLGNEAGDLVLHRQVKTNTKSLHDFLRIIGDRARREGGYRAIVEVCGFNTYLLNLLEKFGCDEVVLVQPEERSNQKTDRRDARALRELLWVNRDRFAEGKRPAKMRVVRPASEDDAADRQLTNMRKSLTDHRTKVINKVRNLLRKWNLQHDCPTKGIQTKRARAWLGTLELPEMDRMEMNILLEQWDLLNSQLERANRVTKKRYDESKVARILGSIPGMSYFSALSVACRIGDIEDFRRSGSLANFWGLTPGSRNSGNSAASLGITKAGSSHVRYVLGQVVLHVLRQDAWMREWYRKVKRRRGSKIARVAVMRRLATIIWSMIKYKMAYVRGGPEKFKKYMSEHQKSFGGAASAA